ncbi:MAG: YicC/YloC family endoribonuclease [Pseudomonadota bacterium]
MLKSMTAFGRRETNDEWGKLSCELRAVNHRYLEISIRLPDELRAIEMALREKISKRVKRGKIECTVRYKPSDITSKIDVNLSFAQSVINACGEISSKMPEQSHYSAMDVLRWPGVVSQEERDFGALQTAVASLLNDTLDDFIATREREGVATEKMISDRCDAIANIVVQLRDHRPSIVARLRERLQTKLDELSVDVDQQRLEQELVIAAQKLDVDEELDRLDAHVDEVRKVLKRNEPVGRRLDFLMQEFNREANTLGSKSQDKDSTAHSVELKVLIEQMREQVQNVE